MIFTFYILILFFQQLIFKFLTIKLGLDISLIYIMLFSIIIGLLIAISCNILNKKTNKILNYILTSFISLIFAAQFIYYCIYSSPFSFYSLAGGGTGQALDALSTIIELMQKHPEFLLFFLPIVILFVFSKTKIITFDKISKKNILIYVPILFIIFVSTISLINFDKNNLDSSYQVYYNSNNLILQQNKFGLMAGIVLDIKESLFYKKLDLETLESKKLSNTDFNENEYNILEINFDELLENNKNKKINQITEYLSNIVPTNKNEYSELFKGKNLIIILGESLSEIAISEEYTPTLYKLRNEGINFTNFYTPLFPVSTNDGEYLSLTGLVPASGSWSLKQSKDNLMKFNTASLAKENNYSTLAFHDHLGTYFSRSLSVPNLGFDSFTSCEDMGIDCTVWPESDIDMIEATTKDFMNLDNLFLTYYISVSGHLPYISSSYTANKNFEQVKDMNVSEKAKNYISTQIEFDNAIKLLIEELDKNGKLEDTVIAIYPDHYPYGLSLNEINELSSFERDKKFEIHKNAFIIWTPNIEHIDVDTLCSNIDIMPTIANLFGFKYDSRMIIGKDIFSDSEKIVMFSDQSFITDKVKYNSLNNTYINMTDSPLENDYLFNIKKKVSNNFRISSAILTEDYYKYVFTNEN